MARHVTELNIQGTVYTIKDLAAHEALRTKADLVYGKIPEEQMPYLPASNDDIISLRSELQNKVNTNDLSKVAFSGDYNDLNNLPELITIDNVDQVIAGAVKDFATKIEVADAVKDMATKTYVDNAIANIKPSTPGTLDYTQLSNKPSINGVTLTGNLTTEQLNITIPEIPAIPTNISAFTNDVGYITEETDPIYTAEKDLLATKEYVSSSIAAIEISKIVKKIPLDIKYTNAIDNILTLDITDYPYTCVAAVLLTVVDGDEFIPLYSENGIARIVRSVENNSIYLKLTLGSAFQGEWTGKLYLTQFIDTMASPGTTDRPDTYQVMDYMLHMVDDNADGYPHFDTTNNTIVLESDSTTDIAVDEAGILTITAKS